MELVSELHGVRTTYQLDGDALAIASAKDTRRIGLDEIAQVRLARWAELSACELRPRTGAPATIVASRDAERADYARLIAQLHQQLADRPVRFVRGGWTLVAFALGVGVLMVSMALVLQAGWLGTPPAFLAGRERVAIWLGLAFIVLGPLLGWSNRPRPYDPRALPADLLR